MVIGIDGAILMCVFVSWALGGFQGLQIGSFLAGVWLVLQIQGFRIVWNNIGQADKTEPDKVSVNSEADST